MKLFKKIYTQKIGNGRADAGKIMLLHLSRHNQLYIVQAKLSIMSPR